MKYNCWTYEKCFEVAKLCANKGEFLKNYYTAYNTSRKNGWLDVMCAHMELKGSKYKRCIYSYEFIDEKCVYVGLTYSMSIREKYRNSSNKDSVRKYINKTGYQPIIKQLTEYVDVKIASKLEGEYVEKYRKDGWKILNVAKTGSIGGDTLKWNKTLCSIEAKKYGTRNEFRLKSAGAYGSASKRGWLDEICSHMINGKIIWNKEKCVNVAKLYSSKKEFQKKSYGAYKSALKNGWLNEITSHMARPKRNVVWTYDMCKNMASTYNNKKEFKFGSNGAYQSALRNGWLDEICCHMIKLPYNKIYWTKDMCKKAASECESKIEFSIKFSGAYYRSRANGWLNEICGHMINGRIKKEKL